MTGQSNDAAERSAHVQRGQVETLVKAPMVQLPDGSWKLRVLVEAEQEIATLREQLRLLKEDPNVVHINLLAGNLARPAWGQILHIYAEDAQRILALQLAEEGRANRLHAAGEKAEAILVCELQDLVNNNTAIGTPLWRDGQPLPPLLAGNGVTALIERRMAVLKELRAAMAVPPRPEST